MAKGNGTAVVDGQATDATGATATGTEGATKKARPDRSYIVVPVPADLKTRFEDEAKAADVPVGPYVRNLLAKFLGIEIPVSTTARRSKYENDDQRKAAQKERNQSRSGTMRDLMKAFREAQASGKSPEEAAQIASAAIANLLANGPTPAAPKTEAEASAPVEGEPVAAGA